MKMEEKLALLRRERGLSQLDLAERMDVSRQAVSRWETGAGVPSVENLKGLSDLYGVSLDYLVRDVAERSTAEEIEVGTPRPEQPPEARKMRTKVWALLIACILLLAVAAFLYRTSVGTDSQRITIGKMEEERVMNEPDGSFSIGW